MRLIPNWIHRAAPFWVTFVVLGVGCLLTMVTGWLDRQPVVPVPKELPARDWTLSQWVESGRKYDLFHRLELILYDLRVSQAARGAPPLSTNLGMVTIDDATIRRLGHGYPLGTAYGPPLPRHLFGRVIRELNRQGAQEIGLDIILADERPDHGKVSWVDEDGTNVLNSDNVLAKVMRQSGNVVIGVLTNLPPSRTFRGAEPELGGVDSPRDIDGSARRVYAFQDCRYLSLRLLNYANRQKFDVEQGPDGSLRIFKFDSSESEPLELTNGYFTEVLPKGQKVKSPAFVTNRVWHLGIVLAAESLGLDLGNPVFEKGGVRLSGTNGVTRFIPLSHGTSLLINWTARARDVFNQSLEDLLADDSIHEEDPTQVTSSLWTNRVVIVGSTATGNNVADLGATPLAASDYLIATYANVANSIILDRFVHHLPIGGDLFLEVVLGVLGAVVTLRRRILFAGAAVLLVGLGYVALSFWAFSTYRLWLPVAHPLLSGLLFNHAALLTWRVVFEQREQRRVRGIFSKIVSPDVVQELLRAEQHALGGARRKLTVFFADVRGFTEMTDQFQAAAEHHVQTNRLSGAAAQAHFESQASEVLATVNTYLATIADVIKLHQGTLDKYIGDCVMAFWGAPLDEPRHAVRCVEAAISAQRAIQTLNRDREAENQRREVENQDRAARGLPLLPKLPTLQLGTGINTGEMTVGLMGSEAHIMNYTVFGREVNLASRLEGVSGRSRIIVGEGTYAELVQHAPELARKCRNLEPVAVKGFRQLVNIYEVPWTDTPSPG
jgi:class 3 adenylate cyclase/CHASE2 domain-containing sensor protein